MDEAALEIIPSHTEDDNSVCFYSFWNLVTFVPNAIIVTHKRRSAAGFFQFCGNCCIFRVVEQNVKIFYPRTQRIRNCAYGLHGACKKFLELRKKRTATNTYHQQPTITVTRNHTTANSRIGNQWLLHEGLGFKSLGFTSHSPWSKSERGVPTTKHHW